MLIKRILSGTFLLFCAVILSIEIIYLTNGFMPYCSVLTMDPGFTSDYTDANKVGKKKGGYLTGVKSNEVWWKWSYSNLKRDIENKKIISSEFLGANVNMGFSNDDSKALNKVCEKIYKEKEIHDIDTQLKTSFWKYCSPLGVEPVSIQFTQETTYSDADSFGVTDVTLISVTDAKNDPFGRLKDDEFFGKGNIAGTGSTLESSKDLLFTDLYEKRNNRSRGTVKDICAQAYLLKESESNGKVQDSTINQICGGHE